MKIVFCSSEVKPFATTGGLGDVCGSLPLALEKLGVEVTIALPGYKSVHSGEFKIKKINHLVSSTTVGRNVQVLFIENEKLFNREGFYGDQYGDFPDNLERFQFFNQTVLTVLKDLNIKADIIHCHDWHTTLIPAYLKFNLRKDPFYSRMKSVLTLHNMAFQGTFPKEKFPHLGLEQKLFSPSGFEFYNKINLLKGGIIFSDAVTTVSAQYAQEIQTERFGCGLDGVLRARKDGVVGILNGIDQDMWNPQTDSTLAVNYSAESFTEKYKNKHELQKFCALPERREVPLFGFVGRLSHQKGIDLILDSMKSLMAMDIQIVFLGMGEEKYCRLLGKAAKQYPEKLATFFKFNEGLSHQIFAGSDFFLMPSIYEPCGLSQMISLRYGTIPLVFKTGGLADTIRDVSDNGNGFVFTQYTRKDFLNALEAALAVYHEPLQMQMLVKKAFSYDFSWDESARKYVELYEKKLS